MQGSEEEILNSADKPEISKHRTIMTFINLCSWYTLMIWKWALATERKLPQKIEKKIMLCFNSKCWVLSIRRCCFGQFTLYNTYTSSFYTTKIYKKLQKYERKTKIHNATIFHKNLCILNLKLNEIIFASANILYFWVYGCSFNGSNNSYLG